MNLLRDQCHSSLKIRIRSFYKRKIS